MKNKVIMCLALCSLVLGLATGCGNNSASENSIKKLNVDLEKYELPCESGDVCNEIKGKLIQISSYSGDVNEETYDYIMLTNDGNVYLYNVYKKSLEKIDGKTDLTHIDGTLDTSLSVVNNPLIYNDDLYYSIESNGTSKKVDFDFDGNKIISYKESGVETYDNNGKYIYYMACDSYKRNFSAEMCPNNESWIKFIPAEGVFSDLKIKYGNSLVIITEDNKIYPTSMINPSLDKNTFTYTQYSFPNVEFKYDDYLILDDIKNYWYWNDADSTASGNLIVQTNDNKLHHNWGAFSFNYKFKTTIDFNEKVENIFYSGGTAYFLIVGKSNVYLAINNFNNGYDLVKLDELKKYKDNIRSIYIEDSIVYVLLSDGNFYKVYED